MRSFIHPLTVHRASALAADYFIDYLQTRMHSGDLHQSSKYLCTNYFYIFYIIPIKTINLIIHDEIAQNTRRHTCPTFHTIAIVCQHQTFQPCTLCKYIANFYCVLQIFRK